MKTQIPTYHESPMEYERTSVEERIKTWASLCAALVFIFLITMLSPFAIQWLRAAAEIQSVKVQIQELELERQSFFFNKEIADQGVVSDRAVIEEIVVKEVEPSRLRTILWNLIIPIASLFLIAAAAFLVLMLIYRRFSETLAGRTRTTLNIFSASASIAGMVFSAIKYQSDLLDHEVGAYLFLSCLYALIFFVLFLTIRMKIISLAVYAGLMAITVLVGWLTSGSATAIPTEYKSLLSDLSIPLRTIMVIGTIMPILLVIGSLFIKPDTRVIAN